MSDRLSGFRAIEQFLKMENLVPLFTLTQAPGRPLLLQAGEVAALKVVAKMEKLDIRFNVDILKISKLVCLGPNQPNRSTPDF